MRITQTLRRVVAVAILLAMVLAQETWALAGTTGTIAGVVNDGNGASVAQATVTAASPSGSATTTTDATGHFVFLSLIPDTYIVSADKSGYSSTSHAGVSVFADQTQTVALVIATLKQIVSVTSRPASNLVKPGTANDVYSVNASTQEAMQGLGGGGNLNSAYAAIYGTPGVTSVVGNFGFGQVYYVRGGAYSQTGYEYDGVPVNRAFDNYNGSSLTTLGQQELQIYSGSSPSGAAAATQVGFINQVVRTGTYPGFGNIALGIGGPQFYHDAKAEAGGATPNRLFSYYVGVEGVDRYFRILNNQDGTNIDPTGNNPYGLQSASMLPVVSVLDNFESNGPWAACPDSNGTPPSGSATWGGLPVCQSYFPFAGLTLSEQNDREFVTNLHFGIPHKRDAGRDDVQLMLHNFSYQSGVTTSINSAYGGQTNLSNALNQMPGLADALLCPPASPGCWPGSTSAYPGICANLAIWSAFGFNTGETCATTVAAPGASGNGNAIPFIDGYMWPSGTTFGQSAVGLTPRPYYFPNSPANRTFRSGIDPNYADGNWNDGTVVKLQYQKNIGSNAYLRMLGYTFYSDWLNGGASTASNAFGMVTLPALFFSQPDYELNTHTRGAELQYANQLSPQHLLTFTANYTTASSLRWNNTSGSPTWLDTLNSSSTALTDGTNCYAYTSGNATSCYFNPGNYAPATAGVCAPGYTYSAAIGLCRVTAPGVYRAYGTYGNPTRGQPANPCGAPGGPPPGSPACLAAATWQVTVPQTTGGYINTVAPKFTSASLEDQFRPTDRLNLNLGLRFERYEYDLRNVQNPEYAFWFNQANKSYCVDPATHLAMFQPVSPTQPPGSLSPVIGFGTPAGGTAGNCYDPVTGNAIVAPSGAVAVHPGFGGTLPLSNVNPSSFVHAAVSPRISGTYTFNADNVVRFSAGRYGQPSVASSEQYTFGSGRIAPTQLFSKFYNLGFNTPGHDNPIQTSTNVDFSFEHRFKGTDMSLKITPFYRYSQNQSVTVNLAPVFASAVNVGTQKTTGFEVAFSKGDPGREGLSAELAVTYVNSLIRYGSAAATSPNAIDILNNYVRTYNGLTSFCQTAGTSQASAGPLDAIHLCPSGNGSAGSGAANVAAPAYCTTPYAPSPGGVANTPTFTGTCTGGATLIANPYYNQPVQRLLDRNGFYLTYPNQPPGDPFSGAGGTALFPLEISGFLSYKHNKLTIQPNFFLAEGNKYGDPTAVIGIDPRNCSGNQSTASGAVAPVGAAYSTLPDYQTCSFSPYAASGHLAIPDPYTGRFDNIGQFRTPWQLNIGAQLKYELSPRITATLLMANIYNRCFGGQRTAWSSAYPGSQYVCGYGDNTGGFIGTQPGAGFFYGANGYDPANGSARFPKVLNYPYAPFTGAIPFNAFFMVNVKI